LLVSEGFQVNVALLPEGADPDAFVRRNGGRAYADLLTNSRPYLEFLLDRAAARHDVQKAEGRRAFLNDMLAVAATIPDAAERDQFADRLAHKARVTEGVLRDEIRKAAASKKKEAPAIAVRSSVRLLPAETGLLWALDHRPVEGLAGLAQLDEGDLEGLASGAILVLATSLAEVPPDFLPALLRERLSEAERALFERAAAGEQPPAAPVDCVNALKRMRLERERAALQDEIDRVATGSGTNEALSALWARKKELLKRLEDLGA